MFTGIIEEVGVVAKISENAMTVRASKVMEDLKKANAPVTEHDMRRKMAGLLETAREEGEKAANKTRAPTWA